MVLSTHAEFEAARCTTEIDCAVNKYSSLHKRSYQNQFMRGVYVYGWNPVCDMTKTDFCMIWPQLINTDESPLAIGYVIIGWLSTIYQLAMGWLSAMGWLLAGYWLAIGWPWASHGMTMGWLSAIYQLVICWLWVGYQLAINQLANGLAISWPWEGYQLSMDWLWAGYGLAISSPPFDAMTIVFKNWIAFYQYQKICLKQQASHSNPCLQGVSILL